MKIFLILCLFEYYQEQKNFREKKRTMILFHLDYITDLKKKQTMNNYDFRRRVGQENLKNEPLSGLFFYPQINKSFHQ
jgi:hypothetical protein